MKRLFAFLGISCMLTFFSCSKDDDSTASNYFEYNGKKYELSKGCIGLYGRHWNSPSSSDGYGFGINLFSSGVSYDSNGDMSGTGNYIYMELFSSSNSQLVSGTYTIEDMMEDPTHDPNTIYESLFGVNFNVKTEASDLTGFIRDGSVKVAKSSSTFEITIDGTDNNGKKITGYFKGALPYFDQSDEWKKSPSTGTSLRFSE